MRGDKRATNSIPLLRLHPTHRHSARETTEQHCAALFGTAAFAGAAQNTLLMAATTKGAAITRTGHSRNIRRRDYYLRQFAF